MFGQICYYVATAGVFTGVAFGFYYIYDQKNASTVAYRTLFSGVKFYIRCKNYKDRLVRFATREEQTEVDDKSDRVAVCERKRGNVLMYYNNKEQASYCTDDLEADHVSEIESEKHLLMLKHVSDAGDVYYKRLSSVADIKNATFSPVKKQFLQVELSQEKEDGKMDTVDIHHNLTGFYLEGNKLLDRDFLRWYIGYWYSMKLMDAYSLQIFDKDVNMISLKSNEYVVLENNGYTKYAEVDTPQSSLDE